MSGEKPYVENGKKSRSRYIIHCKRLTKSAKLPTKAYMSDAGWDLYADENVTILPHSSCIVSTGIAIYLPDSYFAKIFDRSGNAANRGFHILAGVVDNNYTGEIRTVIFNYTNQLIQIKQGQRIAQMVILPSIYTEIKEVEELPITDRQDNGFGSSGE